jgi:hypothetical protein
MLSALISCEPLSLSRLFNCFRTGKGECGSHRIPPKEDVVTTVGVPLVGALGHAIRATTRVARTDGMRPITRKVVHGRGHPYLWMAINET